MKETRMPVGRPREFDIDAAVDKAMALFWRKGYEGTSLPDLTETMGISRPSLYAAFGNKEKLFLRVLDRYRAQPASYFHEALKEPTASGVFRALLDGAIEVQTSKHTPAGCLLVQGALVTNDACDPIRLEVAKRRAEAEKLVCERFKKAVDEGDLPSSTDPEDLARFTLTMLHGMAVQAAGGDSQKDLQQVADIAMRSFPFSS